MLDVGDTVDVRRTVGQRVDADAGPHVPSRWVLLLEVAVCDDIAVLELCVVR